MLVAQEMVDSVEDFDSFVSFCRTEQANRAERAKTMPLTWDEIVNDATNDMPLQQSLKILGSDVRCQHWTLQQVCDFLPDGERAVASLWINPAHFSKACICAAALDVLKNIS